MNDLITLVCGSADDGLTITSLIGFMVLVLILETISNIARSIMKVGR